MTTFLIAWLYLAGIIPSGATFEAAGAPRGVIWLAALTWPIALPACFLIGAIAQAWGR